MLGCLPLLCQNKVKWMIKAISWEYVIFWLRMRVKVRSHQLSVQFQPWNCWGLCSEIDVGPPLFTLLQTEMLTDGVWTGRCDQPLRLWSCWVQNEYYNLLNATGESEPFLLLTVTLWEEEKLTYMGWNFQVERFLSNKTTVWVSNSRGTSRAVPGKFLGLHSRLRS